MTDYAGYDPEDDDESYEPEDVVKTNEQALRVTAADIASRLPWAASESPNMKHILERFEYVYNFIKNGPEKKSLDLNS